MHRRSVILRRRIFELEEELGDKFVGMESVLEMLFCFWHRQAEVVSPGHVQAERHSAEKGIGFNMCGIN